ncbi:hypothetical protein Pst134EA_004835 [Puccinia striiformis f. sp. tritici]|uniref:hypothetical protein n=1 Tax=Puccinia striiformis f. sp. tritici TaxID=168172 RepID=UPI0020071EA1|nr:hypothetical protein Pst134EA_004835 [Puccinia striiformis f. sp. tritici]KAH9462009.1 hypothetical protein Pst134EB_005926 [Puccinia striiformis f. sp. tritici]KAH9470924.1 hypothetical protein Pst134EA_004835 [Puccinia striiformis f. sp. tritici]
MCQLGSSSVHSLTWVKSQRAPALPNWSVSHRPAHSSTLPLDSTTAKTFEITGLIWSSECIPRAHIPGCEGGSWGQAYKKNQEITTSKALRVDLPPPKIRFTNSTTD